MDKKLGYKKQQKLSFLQFMVELPDFIVLFISVILSRSVLVIIDMFDSLGELLKSGTTALYSKKLSKDLRFEYNYGIGKVEAFSALLCESVIILGITLAMGVSVYELIIPSRPSDFLIGIVALKVIHISTDTYFFVRQRKLTKSHDSAIAKTNLASTFASLVFDCVTFITLLTVWLLRDDVVGGYITPIVSIIVGVYLLIGCTQRVKVALHELTDKTLPEEQQLKIVSIMAKFYERYSQLYAVKSRKNGSAIILDVHLSFDADTTFEEMITFKQDVQAEMDKKIENCVVNIIVQDGADKK